MAFKRVEEPDEQTNILFGVTTEGQRDGINSNDLVLCLSCDPTATDIQEKLSVLDSIYFSEELDFVVRTHHENFILMAGQEAILGSTADVANLEFKRQITQDIPYYYEAIYERYAKV